MKVQGVTVYSRAMSRYFAMTALLIGGLTFLVPKAVAQVNSGLSAKTQGADASISCEEMQLDTYARCATRADDDRQAPSFEIWCLQIQLYPASRCDARAGDDMQAYEHYRSLAEQFEQQRGVQEERDQEIMHLLNRDPLSHDQMDTVP
jgi:hypothetical protein